MAWTPQTVKAQRILPAVLPLISVFSLPPFPRRHRLRIGPQAFLRLLSSVSNLFQFPLQHTILTSVWGGSTVAPVASTIKLGGYDGTDDCSWLLIRRVLWNSGSDFGD
jgi:hypothetical protein